MNQADKQQDPAFEEYIKGNSTLSSQYREAATEKPRPALDNEILATAHREVRSKSKVSGKPLSSSWQIPLSIAAVVTFCVGLAITVQPELEIFSSQPSPSLTQIEAPVHSIKREFDRLVDKVSRVPTEVLLADEAEYQPAMPAKTPQFENIIKESPVTINDSVINTKTQTSMKRKSSPTVAPTAAKPRASIASSPTILAEEQKQSRLESLEEITQNPDVASARLQPMPKRSLLQPKLSVRTQVIQSEGIGTYPTTADSQIEQIRKLWEDGNKEKAEHELKAFLKAKPKYDVEKLKRKLDSDFVDQIIKALKK